MRASTQWHVDSDALLAAVTQLRTHQLLDPV
jgi:hypothetical protein